MTTRMNLMNVLKSFRISDHNAIAKAAIEADARHIYWREGSKFWTQEQTTEMLSDYTNNIWKSVEEEVDQALATGDTKDTISRLAELAAYEEDEAEKRRKLHMWTCDFNRYVKTGQRRNALFIAAHLKGALIFYSVSVNKELFVRAMIKNNIVFKEDALGINEEFYHGIKASMKAERLAAQCLTTDAPQATTTQPATAQPIAKVGTSESTEQGRKIALALAENDLNKAEEMSETWQMLKVGLLALNKTSLINISREMGFFEPSRARTLKDAFTLHMEETHRQDVTPFYNPPKRKPKK